MADRDEYDDEPKPPATRFSTLDALQVVFLVAACSGVFFTISGPARNAEHAMFRLGIMGLGLLGLVVVTLVKYLSRR